MNYLLRPFLLGIFTLTNLWGQVFFDLQEQYFEYPYKQVSKAGLYKLPYSRVSMVNIHQSTDGKYLTEYASSGVITVRINEPIESFNVSIKARYKSTYKDGIASIVVKSDNGDSFVVAFYKDEIRIQNKGFKYKNIDKETLHINIGKVDNIITTSINSKVLSEYEMPRFSKLERVEHTINNVVGVSSQDCIYDLVIAGK